MKKIALVVVMVIILSIVTGCGTINQYDKLIASYQHAQKAAANGRTAILMSFYKIQNYLDIYDKYLKADIEKTKSYRESLAEFETKLDSQNKQYVDSNGQVLDPSKLDLNKLISVNATPVDMATTVNNYALTIKSYVTTLTEAPLASVDVGSLKETDRYVSEAYNEINAGVNDWNTAVEEYNTERTKASGDVVARVAKALGVRDLPETLTYFSPSSDQINYPKADQFFIPV